MAIILIAFKHVESNRNTSAVTQCADISVKYLFLLSLYENYYLCMMLLSSLVFI